MAERTKDVYLVESVRSSETAWCYAAGGKVEWLPKSLTTLFVNEFLGNIETLQRDLSDFASNVGGQT